MSRPARLTPMLEQYFDLKRQAEDAILFFRLGDFYEMFYEDAEVAAPVLDLVLTARGKGTEAETPMCGVPYHAAPQYVARLIRAGHKVAICDQVDDGESSKGLAKREITRIVTPGTAIDGMILDRESCLLLSVHGESHATGAAWLDVSTGEFFVTRYEGAIPEGFADDVARFLPREAVLSESMNGEVVRVIEKRRIPISRIDRDNFDSVRAPELLAKHFSTQSLKGFGLEAGDPAVVAAGVALGYAQSRHRKDLDHVRHLRLETPWNDMHLDASTIANLEIFESQDGGLGGATLWKVLNETRTAAGGRLLRRWIVKPRAEHDAIFERHDAVDELVRNQSLLNRISRILAGIADLERLTARITMKSASPRECLTLAGSLRTIGELREETARLEGPMLLRLHHELDELEEVATRIEKTISETAPQSLKEGGVISDGVDPELDELHRLARSSKTALLEIEKSERESTGISSLKVRFNNVFGYYIEVSKANLPKVPDSYVRKQTLANAERYITAELKDLEERILGAEEKSAVIEQRIYDHLLTWISTRAGGILATSAVVAEIDAIASLAMVAIARRWVRPQLSEEVVISISEGRHPVVEALTSERFIPNDTKARLEDNGIQIITGPNMGGKSTYLRQVALIVLLNQIGSFVPAADATLGIFDRIFTRVGASDNLSRGESTFMVEMHETANILNNATSRSLIVLDEVGRGTATFDGLSLAWAIVEHLHDTGKGITLFATHYHELTDLEATRDRVVNFNVSVREWKEQIIFLRKVIPGAADKSYGIQVASLAGVPAGVTGRAREILHMLEDRERAVVSDASEGKIFSPARQMELFRRDDSPLSELRELDPDTLSPMEALNLLHEWKRRTKKVKDGND
ncbi:MAG: DNA mismatch repair protein MutS [Acidobacteria bacterium]|nr:DNA mismatch repair protein MutS [Acidobacteriota bacterium]